MVSALKLRQRGSAWWVMGLTAALALLLVFLGPDHLRDVWRFGTNPDAAFRRTSYPIDAVQWIRVHRDRLGARPVHDYQYGGFLLWQLPGFKTFIDGRMPAWQIEDRWIFKDYVDLISASVLRTDLLKKYAIDWALLKRETALATVLASTPGWEKEYEDMKVVVYAKRNFPAESVTPGSEQ